MKILKEDLLGTNTFYSICTKILNLKCLELTLVTNGFDQGNGLDLYIPKFANRYAKIVFTTL